MNNSNICLLYADDIFLLSSYENGLQWYLDVLNEFFIDYKLDVYHKNKKSYGISNGKSHINTFKYKDSILEIVK